MGRGPLPPSPCLLDAVVWNITKNCKNTLSEAQIKLIQNNTAPSWSYVFQFQTYYNLNYLKYRWENIFCPLAQTVPLLPSRCNSSTAYGHYTIKVYLLILTAVSFQPMNTNNNMTWHTNQIPFCIHNVALIFWNSVAQMKIFSWSMWVPDRGCTLTLDNTV